MDAPTNFSILDNRNSIIEYFNTIKRMLNQKEYTRMSLREVTSIDLPTLCLLGAFMLDRNTKSEYLEVTSPFSNSAAYRFFKEAQSENMIIKKRRPDFNSGAFLSRSEDEVDNKAIGDILTKTVNYFGEKNRQKLRDIHPIIIEIVTNTADHASPDSSHTLPWIINTYETKDSNGNKVKQYCVIDMGVGIYETLIDKANSQQQGRSPWWHTIIKRESSQGEFFRQAIPKGLQSRTTLPQRGKGIKYIYDTVSGDDMYKRFEIITNKTKVNLVNIGSIEKDSSENLSATIYYWEVCVE
ncbi:hypothetical protein HG436_000575 [Candidatus Saccharibacteria bacterium]|nr:hypothetical protein [Candidatus Saccharibacteria bacterium]